LEATKALPILTAEPGLTHYPDHFTFAARDGSKSVTINLLLTVCADVLLSTRN
jgi:hypothetical protein